MDSARASTGVKSRMKSVAAAALLHLLQLLRPTRLLIIKAVGLPGKITLKIGLAEALDSNCRHRQPLFTGGLRLSQLYHKAAKKTKGATTFVFAFLCGGTRVACGISRSAAGTRRRDAIAWQAAASTAVLSGLFLFSWLPD